MELLKDFFSYYVFNSQRSEKQIDALHLFQKPQGYKNLQSSGIGK
jgi:hypothetical protein